MDNRATRVRVAGPLAPYTDGFRTVLAERGYAPSSAAGQLQLMAHLSRWLVERDLNGPDMTSAVVAEFLQARRAMDYRQWLSVRGTAPLLEHLRGAGFVPAVTSVDANDPVDVLLAGYRTYLVEERGLATSTVRNYLDVARLFVVGRRLRACGPERSDRVRGERVRPRGVPHTRGRLGHDAGGRNPGAAALPASGRDHAVGTGGRGAPGGVLAGDIAAPTARAR